MISTLARTTGCRSIAKKVYLAQRKTNRIFFFFSSRRRHTRFDCDWSSDVCSSDLKKQFKITDTENQIFHAIKTIFNIYKITVIKTKSELKANQKFKQKFKNRSTFKIGRASCRERV